MYKPELCVISRGSYDVSISARFVGLRLKMFSVCDKICLCNRFLRQLFK